MEDFVKEKLKMKVSENNRGKGLDLGQTGEQGAERKYYGKSWLQKEEKIHIDRMVKKKGTQKIVVRMAKEEQAKNLRINRDWLPSGT